MWDWFKEFINDVEEFQMEKLGSNYIILQRKKLELIYLKEQKIAVLRF